MITDSTAVPEGTRGSFLLSMVLSVFMFLAGGQRPVLVAHRE
jgi:hypothetical protein